MADLNQEQLDEQLSAYLDGELSERERAEVERRLAADPHVRERLEALRATVRLVQGLPRRAAPEGLIDDLTARIEREQLLGPMERAPKPPPRRTLWPMLASAAVLVIAAGAGFWALRGIPGLQREGVPLAYDDQRGEPPAARDASRSLPRDVPSEPQSSASERAKSELESLSAKAGAPPVPPPDVPDAAAAEMAKELAVGPFQDEIAEGAKPDPLATAAPGPKDDSVEAVLDRVLKRSETERSEADGAPGGETLVLNVSYADEAELTRSMTQLNTWLIANRIEPHSGDGSSFAQAGRERAGAPPGDAAMQIPGRAQLMLDLPAAQVPEVVEQVAPAAGGERDLELQVQHEVVARGQQQVRQALGDPILQARAARAAQPTVAAADHSADAQTRTTRAQGLGQNEEGSPGALPDENRSAALAKPAVTQPAEESLALAGRATSRGGPTPESRGSGESHAPARAPDPPDRDQPAEAVPSSMPEPGEGSGYRREGFTEPSQQEPDLVRLIINFVGPVEPPPTGDSIRHSSVPRQAETQPARPTTQVAPRINRRAP